MHNALSVVSTLLTALSFAVLVLSGGTQFEIATALFEMASDLVLIQQIAWYLYDYKYAKTTEVRNEIVNQIAFLVMEKICLLFLDCGIVKKDSPLIVKIRVKYIELIESAATLFLSK